jgi:hypothetical protein
MTIKEVATRNPSSTLYTIRGPLEEVMERARELLEKYHPLGYGTFIKYLGISREDGLDWECQVARANSCE